MSKDWTAGKKGKDAASMAEGGTLHTSLQNIADEKFWNLYICKSNKLLCGTVYGSTTGKSVSGSIRAKAFEDTDERDKWIEATIAKKKNDAYADVDDAWTIADIEEMKCEAG